MAAPFSSPEEIDQIVKSGNMDPQQAERAKAAYFPNYVAPAASMVTASAPMGASAMPAWSPTDGTLQPSDNMTSAVPAVPVANPNVQSPMAAQIKTESQSTRIAPGAIQGANQSADTYANSAKDLMEATAAHNISQAELRASQAQDNFKEVEKNAAQRDLDNKAIDDRRGEIRAEIDKLATQKVDSGRFYQNMSTGDKVMAAISVALGGFASAMQGQPGQNAALAIIDKAVQRDIDEQMKNLENSRQVVALKDQDLSRLVQITGSKQAARDALMAKQFEMLATQLEVKAAKTPDPTIAARAQNLADQLKMSIAQKQMDVEKNVTQFTSATGGSTASQHIPVEAAAKMADHATALEAIEGLKKKANLVGPGKGRMEQLKGMAGSSNPEFSRLESELNLSASKTGKSLFGNMSESERKIALEKIFPSLTEGPDQYIAKLNGIEDQIKNQIANENKVLSQSGYHVPNMAPAPTIKETPLRK